MVKQLCFKAGFIQSTLVFFGWLTFFWSFVTTNPIWVVVLQSVARVLPKVLSSASMYNEALQLTARSAAALRAATELRR